MSQLHHQRSMSPRENEGGFAALIVVLAAATLATLSFFVIDFGKGANRVATEKQLLDAHGVIVGQSIIRQGLSGTCSNGQFTGDTEDLSVSLFGAIDTSADRDDRTYQCEELDDGEVFVREEGDPSGPAGTFRRYRVSSNYNALQDTDDPNPQGPGKTRSVIVEVRELNGEVERPRPQIMFVLDYSGSMSSNGRANRLKEAMQEFVNAQYEVDYGVILFDSGVRTTIGLGAGDNHNSSVMGVVNSNSPGGGTNFHGPLTNAVQALNATNNQHSYVVLVSDGVPGDGNSARSYVDSVIRSIDPNICTSRSGNQICHTVYTLGVDGADIGMLESLSGNASTPAGQRGDFTFEIASQDTQLAFRAIVDDILCSFGPLNPQPAPEDEDTINVFLNDTLLVAGANEDYEYDSSLNAIKLYDQGNTQACTNALENDGKITIRYGKPRVIFNGNEY